MEKHEETEVLIRRWEHTGYLSPEEKRTVNRHVGGCDSCRRRYRLLLPFVNESGDYLRSTLPEDPGKSAEGAGEVMARISGKRAERTLPRRVFPHRRVLVAAAAVLLAAAGVAGAFFSGRGAASGTGTENVIVRFELSAPAAEMVEVAGDFTGWGESPLPLTDEDKDGVWEATVTLKRGGTYVYNFVIDGEKWIPDPDSEFRVSDGFGGMSTLLNL